MMDDEQIKHMANRFLCWRLPENFRPDAGISFKPTFNDHMDPPMKHNPIGTNLFDADQAEAMVRYMVEGIDATHSSRSVRVEHLSDSDVEAIKLTRPSPPVIR
jgi:hypothetical protein